jgi:hypothetical protein
LHRERGQASMPEWLEGQLLWGVLPVEEFR